MSRIKTSKNILINKYIIQIFERRELGFVMWDENRPWLFPDEHMKVSKNTTGMSFLKHITFCRKKKHIPTNIIQLTKSQYIDWILRDKTDYVEEEFNNQDSPWYKDKLHYIKEDEEKEVFRKCLKEYKEKVNPSRS